jgi:hypothetical protein
VAGPSGADGGAAVWDTPVPPHGNWQGLSLGWVPVIWAAHSLLLAAHRLQHVEPWAEKRLPALRGGPGHGRPPLDGSADRRASVWQA